MTSAAPQANTLLGHPITFEVIDPDDVPGIKKALAETQRYLDRPEVSRMYAMRRALQARLGELEPTSLPRRSQQTDTQRKVQMCPRCLKRYDLEPESTDGGSDEAQATDREAAPSSSNQSESQSSPQETGEGEPVAATQGEAADGAASPPPTLDDVIVAAGNVEIKGVGTVAQMVESDPHRCLVYLAGGKDETLKAALTTYMYAVRPDLMGDA